MFINKAVFGCKKTKGLCKLHNLSSHCSRQKLWTWRHYVKSGITADFTEHGASTLSQLGIAQKCTAIMYEILQNISILEM